MKEIKKVRRNRGKQEKSGGVLSAKMLCLPRPTVVIARRHKIKKNKKALRVLTSGAQRDNHESSEEEAAAAGHRSSAARGGHRLRSGFCFIFFRAGLPSEREPYLLRSVFFPRRRRNALFASWGTSSAPGLHCRQRGCKGRPAYS